MGQVVWYEFIESEDENLHAFNVESVVLLDAHEERLYSMSQNVEGRPVFYLHAMLKNKVKGHSNPTPLLYDGTMWATPGLRGVDGGVILNAVMNIEKLPNRAYKEVLSDQHRRRFRTLTTADKRRLDEVITAS